MRVNFCLWLAQLPLSPHAPRCVTCPAGIVEQSPQCLHLIAVLRTTSSDSLVNFVNYYLMPRAIKVCDEWAELQRGERGATNCVLRAVVSGVNQVNCR